MNLLTSASSQPFPFHDSLMNYIQLNLKVVLKDKLAQSCRIFYKLYPYQKIIQRLCIGDIGDLYSVFKKDSIHCRSFDELRKYTKNIWVKHEVYICALNYLPFNFHLDSISQAIVRCTAKEIYSTERISFKDFKLLTEAGSVEKLDVHEIIESNGDFVTFDEIITNVPNAHKIRIYKANGNSNTKDRLASIKHKQKIQSLQLYNAKVLLNLSSLFNFLKKNSTSGIHISITFDNNVDIHLASSFHEALFKKLATWQFADKKLLN